MEDTEYLYGVYDDGTGLKYPGRWMRSGHYMPQLSGEYKTALDLVLPAPTQNELK